MKIENAKMRGLYAGLIAGIIGGIVVHITLMVVAMLGLHPIYEGLLTIEGALYQLSYELGQVGISGAVFGIFYSMFYKAIPGKYVKKSFVFGLIILLFSNLWWSSYFFLLGLTSGIQEFFYDSYIWSLAVFMWLTYGIFLGIFYERWK